RSQRVMAAAHVPFGRRSFSLGDSHCGTFEINKNCDHLRLISRENPTGGGQIVANSGSYSAYGRCCKSGGRQNRVADEGVGAPFVAEGPYRPVARNERGVVAHRPYPRGDRVDQLLLIAAQEIPAPDRALE